MRINWLGERFISIFKSKFYYYLIPLFFDISASFLQEDDSRLAEEERQRVSNSTKLKVYASNLLNRMDEIGMDALLENDLESHGISGRPKEKVTATELLNALKEKLVFMFPELEIMQFKGAVCFGKK